MRVIEIDELGDACCPDGRHDVLCPYRDEVCSECCAAFVERDSWVIVVNGINHTYDKGREYYCGAGGFVIGTKGESDAADTGSD